MKRGIPDKWPLILVYTYEKDYYPQAHTYHDAISAAEFIVALKEMMASGGSNICRIEVLHKMSLDSGFVLMKVYTNDNQ